jgi:hypothetical protein
MTQCHGSQMASEYLPDSDHIVRHVSHARQDRDPDTDALRGVLYAAFEHRPGEPYLSVSWLEYYQGTRVQQVTAVAGGMSADGLDIRPKSCLALSNVGEFKRICRGSGSTVRIIHEETANNPAHTAVRRLPRDNVDLLELLAKDAVCDLFLHRAGAWYSAAP